MFATNLQHTYKFTTHLQIYNTSTEDLRNLQQIQEIYNRYKKFTTDYPIINSKNKDKSQIKTMTKAITYEETETREKLHRIAKNTKNIIEIDDLEETDTIDANVKQVRTTVTGKTLDEQKMLKRKLKKL